MPQLNSIVSVMQELQAKYEELTLYDGFGYCGYGSFLLNTYLKKHNIDNNILLGEMLQHNDIGEKAIKHNSDIIMTFPNKPDGEIYYDIKHLFIKRGHKLPERTGHAVVLIGNVIFDITSQQFGLPNTYSLRLFEEMWKTISTVDLTITDDKDSFYVKDVKKTPFLKTNNKLNKPNFVNW